MKINNIRMGLSYCDYFIARLYIIKKIETQIFQLMFINMTENEIDPFVDVLPCWWSIYLHFRNRKHCNRAKRRLSITKERSGIISFSFIFMSRIDEQYRSTKLNNLKTQCRVINTIPNQTKIRTTVKSKKSV